MSHCEDFPCCGHEPGCCPDFDPETGEQLNMRCTCGAAVPLNSASSLCEGCLRRARSSYHDGFDEGAYGDEDAPY